MYKEMCFYITKEFQENPPEPVDEEVKIKKSNERIVFVKQFGGYAMKDDVWLEAAEKFRYILVNLKMPVVPKMCVLFLLIEKRWQTERLN